MPEELVKPEELSKYRQVASHVVSGRVPVLFLGWGRPAWRAVGSVSAIAAELSGLLFPPSFPSNAVRGLLHPGRRPSAMNREQNSVLFPWAGDGNGGVCGSAAFLDVAVTGFGVALSAQGLHSASIPGILALDLCPSDTNKILTGESWPGLAG